MKLRLTSIVLAILASALLAYSEGTKQIRPFAKANGELCIDKSRNDFAFFDGASEFRLNIYVANPSERICFGFGICTMPDTTATLQFRIKDPSGNIVYGPDIAPSMSAGYINSYAEAVVGPFPSIGGYNPIVYQPTTTGNFYLEFFYPPGIHGTYEEVDRYQFRYFDITVLNTANKAMNGRVWSKAWQFNCGLVQAPPTTHRFYGNMYILSDDSVVTKLNCNGFVGGTFSISSNETGCSTSGNVTTDRQSREGFHTYPQYKVFLNDPDSTIFPTGKLIPGIVPPVVITTDCNSGSVDFSVQTDHDGSVELYIDVNPAVNPDSRDVKIISTVFKNPGGTGYNIIHWNGKDNTGIQVPNGTAMQCSLSFISGMTHLPIYDIEFNDTGYIVGQIRPKGSQLKIYWDDSRIPQGDVNDVIGCLDAQGCHTWDSVVGDMNTLNSWWFVVRSQLPPVPFTIKKLPLQTGPINGLLAVCRQSFGVSYTVNDEPNSDEYIWSYSGNDAYITSNGRSITMNFGDSATSGILRVFGRNASCGDGPVRETAITVNPIPVVTLLPFDTICYNSADFPLVGGAPSGGFYMVDGTQSAEFQPLYETPGEHEIIYSYTSPLGCTSYDTSYIVVRNDKECAPIVFFPNAFSPNGDGLNDVFSPVYRNIFLYHMEIYDRTGTLVFTTNEPNEGWDGKCNGELSPPAIYVFKATYQETLISSDSKMVKGTVLLLR